MYYNHPIHGDPDPEELEEFRESMRGYWTCHKCKREHPMWHGSCFYCNPTINKTNKKTLDKLFEKCYDVSSKEPPVV